MVKFGELALKTSAKRSENVMETRLEQLDTLLGLHHIKERFRRNPQNSASHFREQEGN